jgi:hypothetical protein
MLNFKLLLFFTAFLFCIAGNTQQLSKIAGFASPEVGKELKRIDSKTVSLENKDTLLPRFDILNLEASLQKKLLDSLMHTSNIIANQLIDLFKKPLVFQQSELNYSGSLDNSYFNSPSLLNKFNVSSAWAVTGVPMQGEFYQDTWNGFQKINYKYEFNKDNYLKQLKARLSGFIKPDDLLKSIEDPLANLKLKAEQALQLELKQVNSKYNNGLQSTISQLGDFQSLMQKDLSSLEKEFLNPSFTSLTNNCSSLIQELQLKMNMGQVIDTTEFLRLKTTAIQLKGLQELIGKVIEHKKQWERSGLIKSIKDWEDLKKLKVDQLLSNPSTISVMARQQFNLTGLQKIFLKLNQLKSGLNSFNSSPLSFSNYLNNGSIAELMDKGKSVLGFIGKASPNSSISDMPFINSALPSSFTTAFQLAKSNEHTGSTHFSFINVDEGLNALGLPSVANFRHSVLFTVNKEIYINGHGVLTSEISKSVSRYNTNEIIKGESPAIVQLLSLDNLANQTSFLLNYRDELPQYGLSYQFKVDRTADGYDNPGNPFLNSGSSGLNLSVKKQLFKNKLLMDLRSDLKEYKFSPYNDDKWRSFYSVFNLKLRLNKGQYLNLRFLPSSMIRFDSAGRTVATRFDRIAIDGNISQNLGHLHYNNFASIYWQGNNYNTPNGIIGSNNVGLSANQSLVINKYVLFWNTQYNQALNKSSIIYFNSSVNSDLGTTYTILKLLQGSTSLGYNQVASWYKQIGLRQNVSVTLMNKFDFNFFLDLRHNIVLFQSMPYGQTRGEVSLHYLLNRSK